MYVADTAMSFPSCRWTPRFQDCWRGGLMSGGIEMYGPVNGKGESFPVVKGKNVSFPVPRQGSSKPPAGLVTRASALNGGATDVLRWNCALMKSKPKEKPVGTEVFCSQ